MSSIGEDQFDSGIQYNLGFCLSISVPLFIVFCVLRKKVFNLYYANLYNRNRTKIPGLKNGTFSWMISTFRLTDNYMLLLSGMDGFVFLKSLKLMLIVMLFLGLSTWATLVPTYYYSSARNSNYYVRMCIRNIPLEKQAFLWIPFMVIVVCTVFVFYAVYLFYRNFVVYRQAYMKSPSAFQALNKIETYSSRLRSFGQCLKFFDVVNRAIIVSGISSTYTTERIEALFEDMRLGDIQSIFIAKDRSSIMDKLSRANTIHKKLEALYYALFTKIMARMTEEMPEIEQILKGVEEKTTSAARQRELFELVNSPAFFPQFRKTMKNKLGETVDAIEYLYGKLKSAEEKLDGLIEHFINDSDSSICSPCTYTPTNSYASEMEGVYDSHTGLISFTSLKTLKLNINDLKLTVWGTSASAIIIFKDWKSATIASQTLLSARPFSFVAKKAPMVTEVDWDNVFMPKADQTLRNVLGNLLYIIINIFFAAFVTMLTNFLQLDVLVTFFPFLNPFFARYPEMTKFYAGIVRPLSLNIVFAAIPHILLVLTYYQAYVDKAQVQLSIMNKYSWLLFLQTLVVALAGSVEEIIKAIFNQDYATLFAKLDKKALETSSVLLNLALQKALIGMMLVLTKPVDILLALMRRIFSFQITPRMRRDLNKPVPLPLGFLYPEYAVIIFQICLSFSFITPLILGAGSIFFALAYFIFRAQFIYANKIPHETGGIYWPSMSTHIIIALIMAQFITLVQFVSLKGRIQAFMLAPVIAVTTMGMFIIRSRFKGRIENIALSGECQEAAFQLIREQTELRDTVIDKNFMPHDDDGNGGGDETGLEVVQEDEDTCRTVRTFDTINILKKEEEDDIEAALPPPTDDDESVISQSELRSNPYVNPVLMRRLRSFMLPLHFFDLVQWVKDNRRSDCTL